VFQLCHVTNILHKAGVIAFGAQLRKIRKIKGLSQEQLAATADIELSQVSRIERGVINTSISQAFILAEALGISHIELFNFEISQNFDPSIVE
jgi:transcriptional regulator with XRE-family HTH domain